MVAYIFGFGVMKIDTPLITSAFLFKTLIEVLCEYFFVSVDH